MVKELRGFLVFSQSWGSLSTSSSAAESAQAALSNRGQGWADWFKKKGEWCQKNGFQHWDSGKASHWPEGQLGGPVA
jgi:hypothetical protein